MYKIILNEEEMKALLLMLDTQLKTHGLKALTNVVSLYNIVNSAEQLEVSNEVNEGIAGSPEEFGG